MLKQSLVVLAMLNSLARAQPSVDPGSGFDLVTDPQGANVTLDGDLIGKAPLRIRSLLAGKHTLEVGGIAGYEPVRQEILVESGKRSNSRSS